MQTFAVIIKQITKTDIKIKKTKTPNCIFLNRKKLHISISSHRMSLFVKRHLKKYQIKNYNEKLDYKK